MKTRDKILLAGRLLYNLKGVASITSANIAEEMDISPGNLHYHFKNKLQIIDALVKQFSQELGKLLNAENSQISNMEDLWFTLHIAFELQEQYCFVFRDTDYLLEKFPELEKHMKNISTELSTAAVRLCIILRANNAIVATDDDIESIATNILLTYTQWLNFRRFYPGDTEKGYIALGAFQILSLFKAFASQETKVFLEQIGENYRRL